MNVIETTTISKMHICIDCKSFLHTLFFSIGWRRVVLCGEKRLMNTTITLASTIISDMQNLLCSMKTVDYTFL
jgi:5'(3')-deoxyribonucleotidase